MVKKILGVIMGLMLAFAFMALAGAPAQATEQDTTEVYWEMPDGGSDANVLWPQLHSPQGAVNCGAWYQVDTYPVDAVPALIADRLLLNGEDHGIAISWRFEYGGDCEPDLTLVTPNPPQFVDVCGNEITVQIPTDTDEFTYSSKLSPEGVATVTATAMPGYTFGESQTMTWTHEFSNEECPAEEVPPVEPPVSTPPAVVPPVVEPPAEPVTVLETSPVTETLPETGTDWALLPIAAILIGLGVVVTMASRARSHGA